MQIHRVINDNRSFFTGILMLLFTCSVAAQYGWPTGLNASQQQNITSTFMEYRPGRYHAGIDITPVDDHTEAYNVTAGIIDEIFKPGPPNRHNERILVNGYSYLHVDVNDLLEENMHIDIDTWLGSLYQPNPSGIHLHFEEGGQFFYGYAYNPFYCNLGIQPYADDVAPEILGITCHEEPSGNPLTLSNLHGKVDIQVHCKDRFTSTGGSVYDGAVYAMAYQLRSASGIACQTPNWNFLLDYWTTHSGFEDIWASDDHIWVTNYLNPGTGESMNDHWNTADFRNDTYRLYIMAEDLSCAPGSVETYYNVTINNPPIVKTEDVVNTSEVWRGEIIVRGTYDPELNRNILRVKNSYFELAAWSRIVLEANVWLIIETSSNFWQDTYAVVDGSSGGEIIIESGGNAVFNNDINFLGPGACVYNKGTMTIGPNTNFGVENDGLIILDGGELIIEDHSNLMIHPDQGFFDIRPGSVLKLGKKAKIENYGKMLASGNAGNPILFTSLYRNPSLSSYWDGIYISSRSPEYQSLIEHTVIEYGRWGVLVNKAHPEIRNTTIRNCNLYALRLDYSTADIIGCTFENSNAIAGVYMRYSDPVFKENNVRDNQDMGVYLLQSNPLMQYNTIESNDAYGVYCAYYSSPALGSAIETNQSGNNTIEGHETGIFAYYFAHPFLGELETGPPYAGYNRILSQDGIAIEARHHSNISAHKNWWGMYPVPGSLFDIDATSSVDYAMALTQDPNAEMISQGDASNYDAIFLNPDDKSARILLKLANKLRRVKQPQKALKLYRQLLRKYPDHPVTRRGLWEMVNAFHEAGSDSAVAMLAETATTHTNAQVRRTARDLVTGEYLGRFETAAAIASARKTITDHPNTVSEKLALFNLVNIFTYDQIDSLKGRDYRMILKQKYPHDLLTRQSEVIFSGHPAIAAETMRMPDKISQNMLLSEPPVPAVFGLFQNYPNPFNPQTTIEIKIPLAQHVKLSVYDIGGKLVRTLADQPLNAGSYEYVWDGENEGSEPVSTGIYFYRLVTEKYVNTRRMFLIR